MLQGFLGSSGGCAFRTKHRDSVVHLHLIDKRHSFEDNKVQVVAREVARDGLRGE